MLFRSRFQGQPLYVSQGHKVGLSTAVQVVKQCIFSAWRRLPEPIFLADLLSRKRAAEEDESPHRSLPKWRNFIRSHPEMHRQEKEFWISQLQLPPGGQPPGQGGRKK